jgi:hypothetical protein
MNFGLKNPDFSIQVYGIFSDCNELPQHSLEQLNHTLWYDKWKDAEWLFDELKKNISILKLIGNKGMCAAKTVCKKLQDLHQEAVDSKEFLRNFMLEYLSEEQRKKLGCIYWLKGIGTPGEFAGNAEMVLFSRLFGLNVLIVKNNVKGPEIQSSRMYLQENSVYELSKITCKHSYVKGKSVSPATIENSIFLCVIDPKEPCTAYEGGHVCEHYVTLNLMEPTHPFVGPDMFTFARQPPDSEDELSEDESSEKEALEKESSGKDPLEKESSEMEPSEKEKEPSEKELSEKEP